MYTLICVLAHKYFSEQRSYGIYILPDKAHVELNCPEQRCSGILCLPNTGWHGSQIPQTP